MPDFDQMADQVVSAAKAFVQRATKGLSERMDAFETQIKSIQLMPGPKGDTGEKGIDGSHGKDGASGVDGKDGADGLNGKDGEKGIDGSHGKDGASGVDGKDGADGLNGKDGENGIDGKDGAPGERGERGEQGLPGDRGELGPAGENGAQGLPGISGEKGADGINGKDGGEGRDGRDGAPGEPGRDALELDVRDGIDETKTYARGTFATHAGGTLRAFRLTTPLKDAPNIQAAGWQVIVDGVSGVEMEMDDDQRTIAVGAMLTSGKSFVNKFTVPTMIHRGVYKPGEYAKGDVTTWDGSIWLALKDTDATPGNDPDAWRLVVKRGRDGKDGKDGEKGERGLPGKSAG